MTGPTPGELALAEAARLEAARIYTPRPHDVPNPSTGPSTAQVDEAPPGRKRREKQSRAAGKHAAG